MIEVDDPAGVVEKLAAKKVFVDSRPGVGLRVSPHFFNTEEEIAEALDTIARVLG